MSSIEMPNLPNQTHVPRQDAKRPRRRGLATRLTLAFALLAGALLLIVGSILAIVSYRAQLGQVAIRQQKTADEAALLTLTYLDEAQDTLWIYGQSTSSLSLLFRSMENQLEELRRIMTSYADMFHEITLMNESGNELAKVSRFREYSVDDLGSRAETPEFQTAIEGKAYISDQPMVTQGSSFPAVKMAVPVVGRDRTGVLAADVSIKGMWDTVAQVEVGETGYAYLVDRESGQLIAHSDMALNSELQGQSMEDIELVRRLMAGDMNLPDQYLGLDGKRVIGAATPLEGTNWMMIVELPTQEALADLRQMVVLLGVLVIVGALVAASLSLVIPRRIVRPLMILEEGAEEFGAGHLDHVITLQTGDELEDLADAFNLMAANLRASQAESERWGREMGVRVKERTRELSEASFRAERRANQLQISADVARAIASVRELDELLPKVTRLISERFGWYHVGIFLLDERREYAVLRAANSTGGMRMLQQNYRLRVGQEGFVGRVTGTAQPGIMLDVGENAASFDYPYLRETRSEMATPLRVGDQIIGALDVQSATPAAYDAEDLALLESLADQVAIAIENARLFKSTQKALDEVQSLHRQYVQREWLGAESRRRHLAYEYTRSGIPKLGDLAPAEMAQVLKDGDTVALSDRHGNEGGKDDVQASARASLAAPIKLRHRIIGALELQEADGPRQWTDDELALVEAVSDQVGLALENARLLEAEQEQRVAAEALREAAVVLSSTLAFDELLQRILDQIGRVIPSDARNLMLVGEKRVRVVNHVGYEQFGIQDYMDELALPIESMVTLEQMRATGRPVLVSDTSEEPGWEVAPELDWLRSYIGAPIMVRGALVGVLNVDSASAGFFTQEHANQLAAFAAQAAIALENTQLVEETSRRAEQLAALHRIGLTITSALDLDEVLGALYERVGQIVDVDLFYVALYDDETGMIEFPLRIGVGGRAEVEPVHISENAGLAGFVILSEEPLHVPDLNAIPEDAPYRGVLQPGGSARTYIGVPLAFREQVFGVLSVQSQEPDAYSEDDVDLLSTIATQASIAIQNARSYERLVETADELREVDRLKTQFLANMSHELRTPLNSIIGFSRVMLKGIDGPLTELQETDLSSIYGSGQHLLSLINSILDMSKIEAGKMDLAFDEVSLHDTFNSVLATARGLLKDRPVELRSNIPDELPTVWADAQRVRQVLFNLVSNATKFTEEGHIELRCELGTEFLTVSVSDTGIGIKPDAQKRLFIPFQQVDASTSRRAGGTGLGLAISRRFVEMHNGDIWVESTPGEGSTFSFTLPIYRVMRDRHKEETEVVLDPNKKLLLAIDDDDGVLTLLKRYLEGDGYQVVGEQEPLHAVETAQRLADNLAAITLDVVMPNMDGWQVLKSLKANPQTEDIPVVLCSIVEGLDQGMNRGAAAFLQKPVTRDELLNTLSQVERTGN
jgi:signal transduction histidine kinase/CheY-like chemotaxis protein